MYLFFFTVTPSKKRKYTHHIPPPSDIQTRGAKVPKYSFERKTHKKILLSSASPPLKNKPNLNQMSVSKIETLNKILDSSKLKEFADIYFKLDENSRKFSKWLENTVRKGEIARYKQFLFFPWCFQKTCTADT